MLKDSHFPGHDAFIRMMRLIPEGTVRAMEIDRLLREYDDVLYRRAEERLRQREEPITEENVAVEMSNLDRENAHSVALNLSRLQAECGMPNRRSLR
ncbi:hypothetical protein MUP01_04045 [Candidatus Bathyarchaeota archaeon]|nr:hypothetical protein [Candidatus Bathyarchaeota archaeon]